MLADVDGFCGEYQPEEWHFARFRVNVAVLPDNMCVFFAAGNIPRVVTAIILPYLTYFIWLFIQKDKK